MNLTFDQLRLPQEAHHFQQLWANPAIPALAASAAQLSSFDTERRIHLANSLRINEHMLPRVAYVVKTAYDRLQIDAKYEIYVHHDATLTASVSSDEALDRVTILLSSSLIERMNDAELLFVIGHELGHVAFEHTRLPARHILAENPQLDSKTTLALLAWARRAELTADRAGLWVCKNFDAATSAFIKLACGLSSEQIQFDAEAYLSQVACLSETETLTEDLYSSHPFSPIRVAALHAAWTNDHHTSQQQVDRLLNLLEAPAKNTVASIDVSAQFLLWAQLAVATADGEFDNDELRVIFEHNPRDLVMATIAELNKAISPTTFALERAIKKAQRLIGVQNDSTAVAPIDDSEQLTLSIAQRCSLIQTLVVTARADHNLDEEERLVLAQLCQALDLRKTLADNILSVLD